MGVGCRNGKALLEVSSASLGTSPCPRVVSLRRSRTVFRYSRDVSLWTGNSPAAVGSAGGAPPPLPPVVEPAWRGLLLSSHQRNPRSSPCRWSSQSRRTTRCRSAALRQVARRGGLFRRSPEPATPGTTRSRRGSPECNSERSSGSWWIGAPVQLEFRFTPGSVHRSETIRGNSGTINGFKAPGSIHAPIPLISLANIGLPSCMTAGTSDAKGRRRSHQGRPHGTALTQFCAAARLYERVFPDLFLGWSYSGPRPTSV